MPLFDQQVTREDEHPDERPRAEGKDAVLDLHVLHGSKLLGDVADPGAHPGGRALGPVAGPPLVAERRT